MGWHWLCFKHTGRGLCKLQRPLQMLQLVSWNGACTQARGLDLNTMGFSMPLWDSRGIGFVLNSLAGVSVNCRSRCRGCNPFRGTVHAQVRDLDLLMFCP